MSVYDDDYKFVCKNILLPCEFCSFKLGEHTQAGDSWLTQAGLFLWLTQAGDSWLTQACLFLWLTQACDLPRNISCFYHD